METRPTAGSQNVVNAAGDKLLSPMQNNKLDLKSDRTAATSDKPSSDASAVVLDSEYLDAQTFGDTALEGELLGLFVAQARDLVPKLASAYANASTDMAHLLKGSARAIGAWRLANAVDTYEATVRTGTASVDDYRSIVAAFDVTEAAIAARLSVLQSSVPTV